MRAPMNMSNAPNAKPIQFMLCPASLRVPLAWRRRRIGGGEAFVGGFVGVVPILGRMVHGAGPGVAHLGLFGKWWLGHAATVRPRGRRRKCGR